MPAVQSYPDPVAGAPRSFVHRVSELSSLEGDTVRQEKFKKMRKSRKPPSWQSASSQSPRSRIKTLETVPTTAEQSKTSMAPCSFQWLALIACLSTLILFTCLTWLIFTFWDSWPGLFFFFFFLIYNTKNFPVATLCVSLNTICRWWMFFFKKILFSVPTFSFALLMACNSCYVLLPCLSLLLRYVQRYKCCQILEFSRKLLSNSWHSRTHFVR